MGATLATNLCGGIAIAKVEVRALEKGVITSRPAIECRYDLIIDEGGRLARAQVKYANGKSANMVQGAVTVHLEKWRVDGRGPIPYYSTEEIDLLMVYVPRIDRVLCFGPDVFEGRSQLQIRIEPARNNQQRGCLMANQYIW
jgi:hypothetical protein